MTERIGQTRKSRFVPEWTRRQWLRGLSVVIPTSVLVAFATLAFAIHLRIVGFRSVLAHEFGSQDGPTAYIDQNGRPRITGDPGLIQGSERVEGNKITYNRSAALSVQSELGMSVYFLAALAAEFLFKVGPIVLALFLFVLLIRYISELSWEKSSPKLFALEMAGFSHDGLILITSTDYSSALSQDL